MSGVKAWQADLCMCGHTRAEHRLLPREPWPITVRKRGECVFPLCPCTALDIDPIEIARAEATAMDRGRTEAREFAREMGWRR